MKKETLEKVAENHINNDLDLYESLVDGHISYDIGMDLLNNLFINGAKWKEEQDKNKCSEIIDLFITEIKNEFKDDNWDYLEFIKERVIKNI